MTFIPATADEDLWAITGAMLAAILRAAWSSRPRERPLNGSAGTPWEEGGEPPREAGNGDVDSALAPCAGGETEPRRAPGA